MLSSIRHSCDGQPTYYGRNTKEKVTLRGAGADDSVTGCRDQRLQSRVMTTRGLESGKCESLDLKL